MSLKKFSLVILLFIPYLFLHAQDQPITFNPNMLVHSQGLPNDFLLFAADTSVQILFNPARAALSERRFVYLNYLPYSNSPLSKLQTVSSKYSYYSEKYYSSSRPTLSAVTLLDVAGSTWLFQASNWVYRNTSDQINNETEHYSSSASLTAAKLSYIKTMNEHPYSIGIFGIIFPDNSHSTSDDSHADINSHYPYESFSSYQDQNITENTNSKYVAGIEFSLLNSDWDFIAQLSIQKNKLKAYSYATSTDNGYYYSTGDTNIYTHASQRTSVQGTDEPLIYSAYTYFQQKTDLITSSDHYFISSTAYYSSGKLFYSVSSKINDWRQQVDTNGITIFTNQYAYEPSWYEKTINWGVRVSTGYVVSGKSIDLDYLIGFNPQCGYDQFTENISSASSLGVHHIWSAVLNIPVYLNFTPASWCSLFGGLNHRYTYSTEKIYYCEPCCSSSSNTFCLMQTQETSSLSSASNLYTGMELRHASGLHLQIAFNNSLSSYSGWNISMGYVY